MSSSSLVDVDRHLSSSIKDAILEASSPDAELALGCNLGSQQLPNKSSRSEKQIKIMGSVSQSSAGGSFPFLRSEIRRSVRAQRRKERMQSAQPHADRFNVCESDPEVTSIRRAFGARKARRYLNELLLRDMEDASSWTVDDMNASFNPVPFGEPRRYPLTQIFEDEKNGAAVRDAFLAQGAECDVGQQQQQQQQQHMSRRRQHSAGGGWTNVSRRGRDALKEAVKEGKEQLRSIEDEILSAVKLGGAELVSKVPSSYQRLLWYSLSQYYGCTAEKVPIDTVVVSIPEHINVERVAV